MDIKTALLLLLDQVDYVGGKNRPPSCKPNEPIGGVLPREIIEQARQALAEDQSEEFREFASRYVTHSPSCDNPYKRDCSCGFNQDLRKLDNFLRR
jgi:hypothetical protein